MTQLIPSKLLAKLINKYITVKHGNSAIDKTKPAFLEKMPQNTSLAPNPQLQPDAPLMRHRTRKESHFF